MNGWEYLMIGLFSYDLCMEIARTNAEAARRDFWMARIYAAGAGVDATFIALTIQGGWWFQ